MLAKARYEPAAYQRETIPFLGLNRSDNTKEGEFSYQKNLSDRRYPFLAPRLPRKAEKFDTEPSALFSWDGAQIMVRDGELLYDGEPLYTVTDGEKQFAVVNTKLVVWPDRIVVDLVSGNIRQMEATLQCSSVATFTRNSLSMPIEYVSQKADNQYTLKAAYAYTYSSVAFDMETKTWTTQDPKLSNLMDFRTVVGRYYIPDVTYVEATDSFTNVLPTFSERGIPDEPKNEFGVYGKLASYTHKYTDLEVTKIIWHYDIIRTDKLNAPLADAFCVGDTVSITGSFLGYYDKENVKIKRIDDATNTLFFDEDTFRAGDAICKVGIAGEKKYFTYTDSATNSAVRFSSTTNVSVSVGDILLIDGDKLHFLDDGFNVVKTVSLTSTDSVVANSSIILMDLSPQQEAVTVSRKIPSLDYICEHENRLCGVSNTDKTIYVSALGDPTNFYDYSGDSGSFAVAVGSEGDFTGICDYGNAVLCWKERTLHKVLGDYPSNYQTATYRFSGVRAGAHKSLANVNETLFFLGVDGVYAYTGNKPSLISRALGSAVLKDGVGGTDGRAYYLSVRNGEAWELLAYDTHTGLWSRSDEVQVVDFCRVGDDVKFLSGDTVYTIGDGEESVEWEAVFVPMYETLDGAKQYNKLTFRVEVPLGGWLAADVRFDGGRWTQVGVAKGGNGVVKMPVPLRRCDKFEIRLRGKGDCAVLDMVREFRLRGDE